MKTTLWQKDFVVNAWKYPDTCLSDKDKSIFLNSLPWYGTWFSNKEALEIKERRLSFQRAEELRDIAFHNMEASLKKWHELKTGVTDIEKIWIQICHWRKLIQSEFDILFAIEPRAVPHISVLLDDKIIELWNRAYNKWKPQIEEQIRKLDPQFTSPDFQALVEAETKARQKELQNWMDRTPRNRSSNCTDGEAEFWRAVNDGNLDSIGF